MFRILLKSSLSGSDHDGGRIRFGKEKKTSGIEIGLRGEKERVVSGGGWVIW
jgi:hypothetical protein